MEITQLFTLEGISTLTGMTLVVMLITQFTKEAVDIAFNKICGLLKYETVSGFPTKAWVAVLSEIILFTTGSFGGWITDSASIYLASINGLALAVIAMESYTALQSKVKNTTTTTDTTTTTATTSTTE